MNVFIIAALSADGYIGQSAAHSSLAWRSKEDGSSFGRITREAGVIVMGAVTYRTFRMKRAPPGRRLIVYTNHPESIDGLNVETTDSDPAELIARLGREGFNRVAIGGGASINSLFLSRGLVDELYVTIEPVLFGGGIGLLSGLTNSKLELFEHTMLNESSMLLHYRVSHIR